jgi:hypothetical protein
VKNCTAAFSAEVFVSPVELCVSSKMVPFAVAVAVAVARGLIEAVKLELTLMARVFSEVSSELDTELLEPDDELEELLELAEPFSSKITMDGLLVREELGDEVDVITNVLVLALPLEPVWETVFPTSKATMLPKAPLELEAPTLELTPVALATKDDAGTLVLVIVIVLVPTTSVCTPVDAVPVAPPPELEQTSSPTVTVIVSLGSLSPSS